MTELNNPLSELDCEIYAECFNFGHALESTIAKMYGIDISFDLRRDERAKLLVYLRGVEDKADELLGNLDGIENKHDEWGGLEYIRYSDIVSVPETLRHVNQVGYDFFIFLRYQSNEVKKEIVGQDSFVGFFNSYKKLMGLTNRKRNQNPDEFTGCGMELILKGMREKFHTSNEIYDDIISSLFQEKDELTRLYS